MEEGETHNRKKTMCISDIGIIELEGMRFHAYHGCLEKERREGNLFIVDFKGELDIRKASYSDKLEDTVNYATVYDIVKEEMETPSDLLEHVAGRIARRISTQLPEFIRFSVRVSKQMPPVDGHVEWSRVTISK